MEKVEKEQLIEHYEMLYIIPIKFNEDEVEEIASKVKDLINKYKGEITYEENPDKKRLAYSIKGVHQGYYILIEFDLKKENLQKLNEKLKLMTEVLRFLILKKKKRTAEEIKKEKEQMEKIKEAKEEAEMKEVKKELEKKEKKEEKPSKSAEDIKSKKVSLKELDKKIDEILEDTDKMI